MAPLVDPPSWNAQKKNTKMAKTKNYLKAMPSYRKTNIFDIFYNRVVGFWVLGLCLFHFEVIVSL